MQRREIEGLCAPVKGEEEDFLLFFDPGIRSVAATDLLGDEEAVPWQVASAFELPDHHHFKKIVASYRQSGRRSPPAYRVKITVEFEPIPDDEAEAAWESIANHTGIDEDEEQP